MEHSKPHDSLGIGTYRLTKDQCYSAVRHALKTGISCVDTAPSYGNIVEAGKAIRESGRDRKNVFVTVKVSEDCLKTGEIAQSLENTMKSMGLDYVDEAILHKPIDPVNNWQRLVDFQSTIGKGRVLSIGVSNFNEDLLINILDNPNLPKPAVNQIEVNPFLTRGNLPNFCIKNGIQVVAHTPLAKGELFHNADLVELSKKHELSCSQLMLKWGISKGYRVIPRSHDFKHIEQNMSLNFELDDEELQFMTGLDMGYSTHPQYLNPAEKQRYYKLRKELKKKKKAVKK